MLLIQFTYAYYVVAAIVAVTVLLLSALWGNESLLKSKPMNRFYQRQLKDNLKLVLSNNGECELNGEQWQIEPSSRISFFGCWLKLKPVPLYMSVEVPKNECKTFFIFKSQLTAKDFSRLYRVINAI